MSDLDPRVIGNAPGSALTAAGYRNQAPGFDPRSGEGARRFGGRFNPPHSFPVLYLCTTRACVSAELRRQADRQSLAVEALLPRELWLIRVELAKVLDLTASGSTLASLGLHVEDLVRDDHRFTQELGAAAHEDDFQAILAPSATGIDDVLAIFPENLAGTALDVEQVEVWSDLTDLPGRE